MCQSDRDKPTAPDTEAEGHLADVARLLNVPPTIFTRAANETQPDGVGASPQAEVSELMTLYLALPVGGRSDLLAYARRLAGSEA